jgi:alkanesulfonate monooxygenase SsuD/methylene tetrahydromethanopterin reductase-like flavin-dependent oxidoreductase (luciferase family)
MRHIGLFLEELREGATDVGFFQELMETVDAAEQWGLDGIWLGEIHFLPTRSILCSPLTIAAAIATRTRRMCVGTAVHVTPLRNPLSIAEDVATIDHLSGGRFEFGIGRSGSPRSYNALGVPYEESQGRLMEGLEVMREAWKGKPFSFHGTYYTVDNAVVRPVPLQQPHPPVRIAALNPHSFARKRRPSAPTGARVFPTSTSTAASHTTSRTAPAATSAATSRRGLKPTQGFAGVCRASRRSVYSRRWRGGGGSVSGSSAAARGREAGDDIRPRRVRPRLPDRPGRRADKGGRGDSEGRQVLGGVARVGDGRRRDRGRNRVGRVRVAEAERMR